jgi:hypothetical protein
MGRSTTVRRPLVVTAALALVGATLVACAPVVPGGLPARDGLTAATAAPSCWSIKQYYPASPDGIYWLWTPKLVDPQQLYCDMTTDGGGWVLVGRGREGWKFGYVGQGTPALVRSPVTGPSAFAPAALPTPMLDGLMNGGRVDGMADGIRLRRAADSTGTAWQEVRMHVKPGTTGPWSWAFGGGIPLASISFDGAATTFGSSGYETNTTGDTTVDDGARRVFTTEWVEHGYQAGFSYGTAVVGSSSPSSYLWQAGTENSAIPFTQVFIRPKIYDADVAVGAPAPDAGLPAATVRPMLDPTPVAQPWGVTGLDPGQAVPSLHAYVKAVAQIGSRIYLGGKFLQVQHGLGGPTFTQSYLAAFDVDSGEWIPSFAPHFDAPVWALAAAPDGSKLFVGGEFSAADGQPSTHGLAALDPATGAVAAGWTADASRPTAPYDVRVLDVQGPWLYLGGNFTRLTGGVGTTTLGPVGVGRLARVRLTDGRPDQTWLPTLDTAPWGMDASSRGDRVYVVGAFNTLRGVALNPTHLAIVDTTTGAAVPGLAPWHANVPTSSEPSNAILEVGNKVYQGGSQHYLHQYDRTGYTFERSVLTKATGGDYQAIAVKDGIVYASCHCDEWQYQDTNTWPTPQGYSAVNAIKLIGAYDIGNNLQVLPEFHTATIRFVGAGGEGPWTLFMDSRGCMWAGGDLLRLGATAAAFYGGWERFCDRDSTAPTTPPGAAASVSGTAVRLTWGASTDDRVAPLHYEVLKDSPTFGTVVVAVVAGRAYADTVPAGTSARYFVRALDAGGNRSATTRVLAVQGPPLP